MYGIQMRVSDWANYWPLSYVSSFSTCTLWCRCSWEMTLMFSFMRLVASEIYLILSRFHLFSLICFSNFCRLRILYVGFIYSKLYIFISFYSAHCLFAIKLSYFVSHHFFIWPYAFMISGNFGFFLMLQSFFIPLFNF